MLSDLGEGFSVQSQDLYSACSIGVCRRVNGAIRIKMLRIRHFILIH